MVPVAANGQRSRRVPARDVCSLHVRPRWSSGRDGAIPVTCISHVHATWHLRDISRHAGLPFSWLKLDLRGQRTNAAPLSRQRCGARAPSHQHCGAKRFPTHEALSSGALRTNACRTQHAYTPV